MYITPYVTTFDEVKCETVFFLPLLFLILTGIIYYMDGFLVIDKLLSYDELFIFYYNNTKIREC